MMKLPTIAAAVFLALSGFTVSLVITPALASDHGGGDDGGGRDIREPRGNEEKIIPPEGFDGEFKGNRWKQMMAAPRAASPFMFGTRPNAVPIPQPITKDGVRRAAEQYYEKLGPNHPEAKLWKQTPENRKSRMIDMTYKTMKSLEKQQPPKPPPPVKPTNQQPKLTSPITRAQTVKHIEWVMGNGGPNAVKQWAEMPTGKKNQYIEKELKRLQGKYDPPKQPPKPIIPVKPTPPSVVPVKPTLPIVTPVKPTPPGAGPVKPTPPGSGPVKPTPPGAGPVKPKPPGAGPVKPTPPGAGPVKPKPPGAGPVKPTPKKPARKTIGPGEKLVQIKEYIDPKTGKKRGKWEVIDNVTGDTKRYLDRELDGDDLKDWTKQKNAFRKKQLKALAEVNNEYAKNMTKLGDQIDTVVKGLDVGVKAGKAAAKLLEKIPATKNLGEGLTATFDVLDKYGDNIGKGKGQLESLVTGLGEFALDKTLDKVKPGKKTLEKLKKFKKFRKAQKFAKKNLKQVTAIANKSRKALANTASKLTGNKQIGDAIKKELGKQIKEKVADARNYTTSKGLAKKVKEQIKKASAKLAGGIYDAMSGKKTAKSATKAGAPSRSFATKGIVGVSG